jgi:hypothetical protein
MAGAGGPKLVGEASRIRGCVHELGSSAIRGTGIDRATVSGEGSEAEENER